MPNEPTFDLQAAHKYFSAHCFNSAWDLIDKDDRTPEENQQMIALNQASLWHWTQRDDCTPKNMSVGYWQTSRIYSLLGREHPARKYGQLSLDNAKDTEPFFIAYAYEALARAAKLAGDTDTMNEHLATARKHTESITDADSKKMLEDDLATIL
jgi:cation transport regulator ChaB